MPLLARNDENLMSWSLKF